MLLDFLYSYMVKPAKIFLAIKEAVDLVNGITIIIIIMKC